MADSLVPENDLPAPSPASAAPAVGEVPANDLPAVPENDLPDESGTPSKEETYGGGAQQAIAGLEGAAQGIAGPLATLAETKLLGVKPEDIAGRAEANPWTHGIAEAGGLIGGALIPGVGEYTIGSKIGAIGEAANAVAKTAEFGKVGQTALKLAVEGGLFHLSDNTSKMILGQTDPEAPVASLIAGLPTAMLLGGTLGGVAGGVSNKLAQLSEGKAGNYASQWMTDLGNRFDFLSKNKDVVQAATDEAQHLHDTVAAATEGGFGLKRDSIERLTKDINPEMTSAYVNGMRATLSNVPQELQQSSVFQSALQKWESSVAGKTDIIGAPTHTPSPADIFDATDDFKRSLQNIAKFEKRAGSPAVEAEAKAAAQLSHYVRTSLENEGAWGEMGNFQKELNGAYSKLQNHLKAFQGAAMSKNVDEAGNLIKEVDPAKIGSVFRSVSKGKPLAGFKDSKIANFFGPAEDFLNTVDKLHANQGIESNIPKVSTNTLKEMLNGDVPPGAKVADWLFGAGPGAIGWAGSHAVGTAVGATIGHPYLGFRAGEHLYPMIKEMGMRPTRAAVGGILRALSSGDHAGIPQAVNYAQGIERGANRINQSVENIFKIGGKQSLNSDHNPEHREKLNKFVESGALNQQIENQLNAGASPASVGPPPQQFAHGGEVMAPEPAMPPTKPVGKVVSGTDHISAIYPDQSMLLGAAKGRINNYLNSIRPQKIQAKLPFDDAMPDKAKEKSYHRALDIANKPLSVLDHIKSGTLKPEDMQHLNQLYPELTSHLQKKLTEKITSAQMKNEKPPYHVRQALSLFMGSAMDSSLTPQSIMAAQASFIQKAQQGPQGGTKGSTSKLKDVPNQYRTADQSRQVRGNRPK